MRLSTLTVGVLFLPLLASAKSSRVVEVRARPKGGEAVWIDGRIAWPDAGAKLAPQITSDLVWSKTGDAVAFTAREKTGAGTLVVVLIDEIGSIPITWPIPTGVSARSVFWLGPQRVGAGPKELDPKIVASWKTSR